MLSALHHGSSPRNRHAHKIKIACINNLILSILWTVETWKYSAKRKMEEEDDDMEGKKRKEKNS